MGKRFPDIVPPVALVFTLSLAGFLYCKDNLTCMIRLDHEYPVPGKYIRYVPVDEKAYIVTDHVMLTRDLRPGHFPDDAMILENDIRAFFFWVDQYYGIKAFITKENILPFHARIVPAGLRMLTYPQWVRASFPYVEEEIKKDGGWQTLTAIFKKDRESFENRWNDSWGRSEKKRELYEQWLEDLDDSDRSELGRIYEYPWSEEYPTEPGRKGE